ncbi:hypothetical protein ACKWTF_007927 [Chironomus riparius]
MSHHSDDLLQAGSDSFWELGNYKRTTKRIEDGYKLCTDLTTLIQERSDIEKSYSKSLKTWSKKWADLIEKGPEYGTTEAAWKSILTESERVSELHMTIKDKLCNEIMQQIRQWQKDNYHKAMMQIKERKEMDDQFKKAQKPWAKLLAKVEKAKVDYHGACKLEKSAQNQERNANSDSSLSQDQLKKMQDRVQKTKDEVQKCKEKYDQALAEINNYNSTYIEDMTTVFTRCQDNEEVRLKFFKETLFGLHKVLNLSDNIALPQIYEEFYHTINNADHNKDLKWWANNYGVNMGMAWPTFVDYENRHSKNNRVSADPVQIMRTAPEPRPTSLMTKTTTTTTASPVQNSSETNSINSATPTRESPDSPAITNGKKPSANDSNPFDDHDEEWDDNSENVLTDTGEPGVPVKALYDYDGAESDELTFKQGEVFEKLEDEDEQGWCKGRIKGRVGLYPANYVESV